MISSSARNMLSISRPLSRQATRALRQHSSVPMPSSFNLARIRSLPQQAVKYVNGNSNAKLMLGVAGGLSLAAVHSYTGSAIDFYDYRYESKQDPDDLASFYGGEELMELFCILPFVGQIMMRNGYFDDDGNVITQGFPGTMKVSMVFSDETNENTGQTDWFNKRERFRNTLFGFTLWDMVVNMGFRTKEDGTLECYHFGEYFHGNAPILSQIMLLVFKFHARVFVWSVEHHINHYAFGISTENEDEAEVYEHDSRKNMPLFLFKNYAWSDLKAMFTGKFDLDKQPSFLIKQAEERKKQEKKEWEAIRGHYEGDLSRYMTVTQWKKEADPLPFQKKAVQIQIAEDIEEDKKLIKEALARRDTQSFDDLKSVLVKHHTVALRHRSTLRRTKSQAQSEVYKIAEDFAVEKASA